MELDIFFLREKVISKNLRVLHIPATVQNADILTKPLSPLRFLHLRDKLQVLDMSTLSRDDPAFEEKLIEYRVVTILVRTCVMCN